MQTITPKRSRNPYTRVLGAIRESLPEFVYPALPIYDRRPPNGADWVHEIKVDGYRCLLHIEGGAVKMFTRRGDDWSDRFHALAEAAKALPIGEAIIDGEVIVANADGLSDFAALQSELAEGRSDRLIFYAFDLLYADGYDLRPARLVDRKEALANLLGRASESFLFSGHSQLSGATFFKHARERGLEGVISKLRNAPYQMGRSDTWRKSLCRKRDTFAVVGFIPAEGGSIAALLLGRREGRDIFYAGETVAGLTFETARTLRTLLEPIAIPNTPLAEPVRKPKAIWVRPELLVDIGYQVFYSDGRLKHSWFKGVRDDLMQQPAHIAHRPP